MATYYNGINGPFIGKVGTVVGYILNGKPVMRGLRKHKRTGKEPDEEANQFTFRDLHHWLHPLIDFLRVGFKNYGKSHAYNGAKSYNRIHAMEIVEETEVFNPSKVLVSYGDLPMPENLAVQLTESGLECTWTIPAVSDFSADYDQLMLLAYDDQAGKARMKLTGQFRNAGRDVLQLRHFSEPGNSFHVFAAFVASDRSRVSNSRYMGVFAF
jgi:hypothetical protein